MAIHTDTRDYMSRFIGLMLIAFLLVAFGSVACQKNEQEEAGKLLWESMCFFLKRVVLIS
jgi:hypothetical protein